MDEAQVPVICGISLHSSDVIRLLSFPPELDKQFSDVVARSWSRGIQNVSLHGGLVQLKLRGNPWRCRGEEAMQAKILMKNVLEFMYIQVWGIAVTCDLSGLKRDIDSRYFKRVTPDSKSRFCAISFDRMDRIRLIEAPDEVQAAIETCVRSTWLKGVQESRNYHGAAEIKLRGTPWFASGTETSDPRMLVLHLITTLERIGWSVYASIDMSSTEQDTDSWVLKSSN